MKRALSETHSALNATKKTTGSSFVHEFKSSSLTQKKKKATTFDLQHQTDTPEGLEYLPKGNILTCVIGLLMTTYAQAQSGLVLNRCPFNI